VFRFAVSLLLLAVLPLQAQVARDTAVELSATVQNTPAQITLNWQPSTYPVTRQRVYRRLKGATNWGAIATPSTSATSHTDTSVTAGLAYEYFVDRDFTGTAPASAAGYVMAGMAVPLVESRGRVILLVDDTMAAPLAAELARLEQDLAGDGWQVLRQDIARTASVTSVKAAITALYQLDPAQTRALLLFGRIPVPYSGEIAPDGHPDHEGAWPADVFYGDMDGTWTDTTVNRTTADRAVNDNVPGDGKYDASVLPSNVELEVGRVDLSTMFVASAGASETELLRQYLNRDHDFRHRAGNFASIVRRGLIDDHFGYFAGEAFAASGWRNFTAFFGSAAGSVVEADWFSTLPTASHLWAYGCGPGNYFSAGGVGSSGDFGATRSLAVFTMLFGSYFGDWDINDSFLRAPLAGPADSLGLACLWAGRPHWHLHPMALGETLGYATRLSQNNNGSSTTGYVANNAGRFIHIALMGDPTLRLHPVAPASALVVESTSGVPVLMWSASTDAVAGYRVFRATTAAGPFQAAGGGVIAGTTYTDSAGAPGQTYHYQVRAVKLETSASGTYWNSAQGLFGSGRFTGPIETWRQAHFGSSADAGAGADGANPDFDALTNLEEYAFTLDPHLPDSAGLPAVTRSAGGYLQMRFTRNVTRTDLTYEVEASADLAAWTVIARSISGAATAALGAHSLAETAAGDVRTVTVEDSAPITASTERFLRVRIAR
jgi:hypothetical protein